MNELGLTSWFEGSSQYYTITNDQGGYTKTVGSFAKDRSAFGCYDLGGNLSSWCADWFASGYYDTSASTVANPPAPPPAAPGSPAAARGTT